MQLLVLKSAQPGKVQIPQPPPPPWAWMMVKCQWIARKVGGEGWMLKLQIDYYWHHPVSKLVIYNCELKWWKLHEKMVNKMIKWLIKMGVYIGWFSKLCWYIIWNLIMYAYLYPFPMCLMIHESMQKFLPHWSRVKKGSSIIAH